MLGLSGARAVVIIISMLAMGAAWLLMPRSEPPQIVQVAPEAPKPNLVEVMIASTDLSTGATIAANDIRWMPWPADSVPAAFIRRSSEVEKEIVGSMVQSAFLAQEPIRRDKLVRREGAGFLAAILPPGKRAVAINIDRSGGSTAGGFILPNDRVDVIRIGRQEGAPSGTEAFISETILANVRVLAIGPTIQNRGTPNEVVTGENATLELDPRQVEVITLAQRNGTLSLALRSMSDGRVSENSDQMERQGLTSSASASPPSPRGSQMTLTASMRSPLRAFGTGALLAAALIAPTALALDQALAQSGSSSHRIAARNPAANGAQKIDLAIGKSLIFDLPRDAKEVFVANPKVANAVVRSARKLFIIGMADGATSIFAMDEDGRQIAALDITVGRDLNVLRQTLRTAMPRARVDVTPAGDSVLLTGEVANAAEAQQANDIARAFVGQSGPPGAGGSTGAVINSLTIRGRDQSCSRSRWPRWRARR